MFQPSHGEGMKESALILLAAVALCTVSGAETTNSFGIYLPAEPGGPANGSQAIRSNSNSTSSAAASTVESFRAMLQLPPSDYGTERDRMLGQGDKALRLLKEREKLGTSWYERGVAAALVLRIESPDLYHNYEEIFRDDWGWGTGLGSGGWFAEGEARQIADPLLATGKNGVLPFLIEKLFNEPQRTIHDTTVIGHHLSLPQLAAQVALKQIGGKDAARAIAVAVIAGDRSSPDVFKASLLSDEDLVAKLIPLLRGEAQPRAAWALGEFHDPRAIQPLIDSLSNRNYLVESTAIEALAKLGPPAIPALRAVLVTPAGTMQQFALQTGAAHALAKMGRPAIPILREALETALKGVPNSQLAIVSALRTVGGPEVVPLLIEALKKGGKEARSNAAAALAEIGGEEARSALLEAFANPENRDQLALPGIAHGLGVLRETRAIDGLCELTTNTDWLVRRAAIEALGLMHSRRAVSALILCLSNTNFSTRGDAAIALGSIGDPSATKYLVARLSDPERFVSSWSQWALARIDERQLIESRIEALRDADPDVRQTSAESLQARTGQKLEPLYSAWRQWWEKNAETYLDGARSREQLPLGGPPASEEGATQKDAEPK